MALLLFHAVDVVIIVVGFIVVVVVVDSYFIVKIINMDHIKLPSFRNTYIPDSSITE